MEQCFNERIFYYWRHGLYGHASLICDKAVETKRNDIYLIIWKSLSQAIIGETDQSISTLNSIQQRTDLNFLLTISNFFIQKSSQNPDFQLIEKFETEIQKNNHNLTVFVAKLSSEIAFLFNDYQLAEDIINSSDKNIHILSILGWVKIMKGQFQESEAIFDEILNNPMNSFHLLTLYGKGYLLSQMNQHAEAIQFYARILSKYEFPEINFEKGIIYINKGNWHSLDDLFVDLKESLPTTLEIDIFNFFHAFYQTGNISKAKESIEKVAQNCQIYESKNWFLMARLSHAFGTLGCRNEDVLFQSMKIAQMAVNARQNSSYCLSVLGFHQIMNNRIIAGQSSLYESIKLDQTNVFADENIMRMNIKCGKIELLKDELDLFDSLHEKSPSLLMFLCKVSHLLNQNNYDALYELVKSINNIILSCMKKENKKRILNSEIENSFYKNVELPFDNVVLTINLSLETIFDSLDEILIYHESPIIIFNNEIKVLVSNILKNLSILIPENSTLRFYKGCFLFIEKKYQESLGMFQTILVSLCPSKISYSLLAIAAIYVRQGEFDLAQKYLTEASLLDTTIRNETFFKLIDLSINPTQDKIQKAFNFLTITIESQSFMNLISFVDIFNQQKETQKSLKLLKLMIDKFTSHCEKALIVVRQAKMLAEKNDPKQSFDLLNRIKKHSKYCEIAIKTEGEIYLSILHDEVNFISTLTSNCQSFPNSKHFELLGDGYFKLKRFNEASEAYTKSIFNFQESINCECVQKCIESLIRCHRYNDAVSTFIKIVPQLKTNKQIIISLLRKMIKIEKLNEVKKCIASISVTFAQTSSFNTIIDAQFLAIKASIFMKNDDIFEVTQSFEKSINIFEEIFNSRISNIYIKMLKEEVSCLCVEAGKFFEKHQKREKAFEFFSKANQIAPTNQDALNALINFHKGRMEMNKCVNLCEEFLKYDPFNENAVLLFTSFQHKDLKKSIIVLKKFLTKKPHFHRVIVRLVEVCARCGENYISIAKRYLSSDSEPGMIFARGVFNVYRGEIESALHCFEKVADNRKWGVAAKTAMFQLYLNPESKYIWEINEPLTTSENIQKAQKLFDQIYPQNQNNKNLENDIQFKNDKDLLYAELEKSVNTDESIKSASSRYSNILNKYQIVNIPAIVGLASCHMRLSKINEANALIDQVIKTSINLNMSNDINFDEFLKPTHETAAFFEEAYLMRAQMLLNESYSNNQQAALHYIFLALELNQSCKKGWKMCAEVYSKSDMYSDAANAFKHCWDLSSHQIFIDANLKKKYGMKDIEVEREKITEIGYSFAIASMKAKKPEDALEMCQDILDINPCFKGLKEKVVLPSFKMLKQ